MKLTEVTRDTTLRFDAKAVALTWLRQKLSNRAVPLEAIADARDLVRSQKPDEAFFYHEISSVDRFGVGEPYWIDEDYIEEGSEEERILSKVENGDIGKPTPESILVPKVRPYLGKFVLVDSDNVYYTRAFLEVRPKGISPQLLYSVLKHPVVLEQIYRACTIGKGYPTLSSFNLTRLVLVPVTLLSPPRELIRSAEEGISSMVDLLAKRRSERDIINSAIEQALGIESDSVAWTTSERFSLTRSELHRSVDVRFAAHFVRPATQRLVDKLSKLQTSKIIQLCRAPISLGTSPEPFVEDSEYFYLGSRAMTAERLDPDKLDFISEEFYRNNCGMYDVEFGDVFLRRSGASLGKVLYFDAETPCIYSDFMMRIRFHDPLVAKYAAYWMRSTFFQHLLHGIKVVGKGLQNVYPYQVAMLPIPRPDRYAFREIVDAIDKNIAENDRLKSGANERLSEVHKLLSDSTELSFLVEELPKLQLIASGS